ncbi:Potassium transporter 8, partial [Dissostichus eleginoides]
TPGWLESGGVLGTHHTQDKELFKGQAGSGVLPSVLINFQSPYTSRGSQLPCVKDRNIDPHSSTDLSLIICNGPMR